MTTPAPPVCTCDTEDRSWQACPLHVSCDADCRALREPSSLEEWRAAAQHWQHHSYLSGCSHGG